MVMMMIQGPANGMQTTTQYGYRRGTLVKTMAHTSVDRVGDLGKLLPLIVVLRLRPHERVGLIERVEKLLVADHVRLPELFALVHHEGHRRPPL